MEIKKNQNKLTKSNSNRLLRMSLLKVKKVVEKPNQKRVLWKNKLKKEALDQVLRKIQLRKALQKSRVAKSLHKFLHRINLISKPIIKINNLKMCLNNNKKIIEIWIEIKIVLLFSNICYYCYYFYILSLFFKFKKLFL